MEQRRVNGKNHWYHETQSTICPVDVLPLVPEAAHVEDRFLLDLTLPRELLEAHARWLTPARRLADALFPASVTVNRLQTFSAYDRLSTALTVAQVYGVQRLCNHYAARLAPLLEPKAISQKDYDDAVSAQAISRADLMAARARLREARLNLGWTRVESPLTGVSSRALKSEGSLVSGPDVLLTTVTQTDPIQVIFGIPDNERLKLRQDADAGRLRWPRDGRFEVSVKLADGSTYGKSGFTDFSDVRVSRETGTSEGRAELPNPDGLLLPGQFVRVVLAGAARVGVFRVPQRAVQEGPQGKYVFIVGAENKAEMRPVETGDWHGGDVVVQKGLASGDQVIVDGVVKLGPGAPVQVTPPAAAPGTAPGSAPAPQAGGK